MVSAGGRARWRKSHVAQNFMSGHPRKLIRDTVKDILINGNTLAGKNIFTNKKIHADDNCMPQVIIHTESESVDLLDQAPRRYSRDLTLTIEIFDRLNTENEVQDNVDQLAWQIENLLADDDDWNGTVDECDLTNVRMEFDENGTAPIGVCILTYRATYLTSLPETIEDQQSADLTDLDSLTGLAPDFGIDIANQQDEFDGEIDAEIKIDTVI